MEEFDQELWLEMLREADNLDLNTRVVLCQYSSHFNAAGFAANLPKQLARSTGFPLSQIRKSLSAAKEQGWLSMVNTKKGRGYQAAWPADLL